MSYPTLNQTAADFARDLLHRKEFYSLKADEARNYRDPPPNPDFPYNVVENPHLKLRSYQIFVRNFINLNTPYARLHLMHGTGLGKSLAGVCVGHEFIKFYKKNYQIAQSKTPQGRSQAAILDRSTPSIFVFGFSGTKAAFVKEMLEYPEFGFISYNEKIELARRKRLANIGMTDDVKFYKDYYLMIKKRVVNKLKGGFYKFYGYDAFVNKLFIFNDIKLIDIENETLMLLKAGKETSLEETMRKYIKSGKVLINQTLLKMFDNSLIICDEIHNTYNMNMKNNRGVAIQYLLDSVPSIRFVSMSATPFNNSPTEVVELINYLVEPSKQVVKKELFSNPHTLLPDALDKIGALVFGKISFMQDVNIKYFPRRRFVGEQIIVDKNIENLRIGQPIPYLKFIKCPMSELHQRTLFKMIEDNSQLGESADLHVDKTSTYNVSQNDSDPAAEPQSEDISSFFEQEKPDEDDQTQTLDLLAIDTEKSHAIPTDGYAIYDIVFPDPNTQFGMFKSADVKNKLQSASKEWKKETGIEMVKHTATNSVITGDFLLRKNVGKYSTKCLKILEIIDQILINSGGNPSRVQKTMIYHDRVKMSGVLLIQELLKNNGILDENSDPVDNTRCCICGTTLGKHHGLADAASSHEYAPVRFVIIHSDIDKSLMEHSLAKFNAPDNNNGLKYMILIGSQKVKESFDFKCIQNLIIMSLPVNIPTMLQVFGRAIRNGSHKGLIEDQHNVDIHILISTVNKEIPHGDSTSPEEYRYIDKMISYMVIQQIERRFNSGAIDGAINREIIMPPDLLKTYFDQNGDPVTSIGNLYFDSEIKLQSLGIDELNLSTFVSNKYYEEEISNILSIIKRLFCQEKVWTYENLWSAVRRPPFGMEVNPALFSENNFIIALSNLVTEINILSKPAQGESTVLNRLFDVNDRHVFILGVKHKIKCVGIYYIAFPVFLKTLNPINIMIDTDNIRDKERSIIRELNDHVETVIVDVEKFNRKIEQNKPVIVSINRFLQHSSTETQYVVMRDSLLANPRNVNRFLFDYNYKFQIKFVAGCIEAVINKTAVPVQLAVISLLSKYGVIVTIGEVAKRQDIVRQFRDGLPADLGPTTPIGFMSARSIKIYDINSENKWIEVNKIAMGKQIIFKENDVIVGHIDPDSGNKFKLRKPVQIIREEIRKDANMRKQKSESSGTRVTKAVDTRLIERGIVCSTKNKYELLKLLSQLGVGTAKFGNNELRIKRLCEHIRDELMRLESVARMSDSPMKYVYFWWDEVMSTKYLA